MSFGRSIQPTVSRVNRAQGQGGRGRSVPMANAGPNYGQRREYDAGLRPGDNAQDRDDMMQNDEPGAVHPNQNEQERRLEHRGSYSVMRPDEKRRSKINQQAEAETRQYEAYKQANKVTYVSYTGTVGGGPVHGNTPAARSRLVTNQPGRYEKLEQRNRYRQEAKDREDEEIRIKRENARRQSERNAQRAVTEHAQKEALHRDDHRRKNQAFLDRLEGKR